MPTVTEVDMRACLSVRTIKLKSWRPSLPPSKRVKPGLKEESIKAFIGLSRMVAKSIVLQTDHVSVFHEGIYFFLLSNRGSVNSLGGAFWCNCGYWVRVQ